jgi:catechol 2,3-dioxygenase-like lactoylglutathione lyase family enzyme
MTTIARLELADDAGAWRDLGFTVSDAGHCRVGTVELAFTPVAPGARGAVTGWTLAGVPDEGLRDVDGLATAVGEPPPAGDDEGDAEHPIGALRIDHLVVLTPDLDRTVQAVERTLGLPLRRTRDGTASGQAVRQAFFRMGEVILEVVGPPVPDPDRAGAPATFFGVAVTVGSLDAAYERLGPDRLGPPKPAVQSGRSIATVRSAAGLQVALALMTP